MTLTRRATLLAASPAALLAQPPAARPVIVATCKGDHTIAFVDPVSLTVHARVPTGEGPHEVCVSADGRTAYASIYGVAGRPGSQLAIFDVASRRELKRVSIAPLRSPHGLVECRGKIWFTAEQSRAVGRFDPASGQVDWTMGTGAWLSHMLVLTPDASKLYTTDVIDNTVTVIGLQSAPGRPPVFRHIPVRERPEGIAISPSGHEVWTGHNVDGDIAIIDTTRDQVVHTIRKASKMAFRLAFTPDGKTVAVAGATAQEIVLFNAASREVEARIPTPGSVPQGLLISPDSRWLFTATGAKILKVDLATRRVTGECEAGQGVDGLAWAS